MQHRLPLGQGSFLGFPSALGRSVALGVAVGAAILLAVWLGIGLAFVRALPLASVALDLPTGDAVAVDAPIVLQATGWGTAITAVRLTETRLGDDGQALAERDVPVTYQVVTEGRLPGESRGVVVRPDGSSPLAYDGRYVLRVEGEGRELSLSGIHGVPLNAETRFATPLRPRPQFPANAIVRYGEPLEIRFNVPVREFQHTIAPAMPTRSWLSDDGQVAFVQLGEYEQGAEYVVEVTGAVGRNGAPLASIQGAIYAATQPLKLVGSNPDTGAQNIAPGHDPVLTFNQPVANPELATEAIIVDPPTAGHFEWQAPDRVQFVTDVGFPYQTWVSLTVLPGPDGLRSVEGGFVEDEAVLAYRTRVQKRIDVNLTTQRVTFYEGTEVALSSTASTGMRGAETPTGEYRVQYKLTKIRMRGVYPNGQRYDVPDVPWVLALFDDYTIHGAPWRMGWGTPQSNGCVSLPVNAAKFAYDWAPVGTPVNIHY